MPIYGWQSRKSREVAPGASPVMFGNLPAATIMYRVSFHCLRVWLIFPKNQRYTEQAVYPYLLGPIRGCWGTFIQSQLLCAVFGFPWVRRLRRQEKISIYSVCIQMILSLDIFGARRYMLSYVGLGQMLQLYNHIRQVQTSQIHNKPY